MPIAWHLKRVCVYHNTLLNHMRIAGALIPYCKKCVNKRTFNAKRAESINSYVNKALGKNDYTPLWKHRRTTKVRIMCRECLKTFLVNKSFAQYRKYCSAKCSSKHHVLHRYSDKYHENVEYFRPMLGRNISMVLERRKSRSNKYNK